MDLVLTVRVRASDRAINDPEPVAAPRPAARSTSSIIGSATPPGPTSDRVITDAERATAPHPAARSEPPIIDVGVPTPTTRRRTQHHHVPRSQLYREPVSLLTVLAQADPTGLSSPVGRLVVIAGLLASLVLLLRWWWQQRGR